MGKGDKGRKIKYLTHSITNTPYQALYRCCKKYKKTQKQAANAVVGKRGKIKGIILRVNVK